jgi:triacylglycerol lipase
MNTNLELAIGVLNGLLGDYLKRTGNGLATPMQIFHGERAMPLAGGDHGFSTDLATPKVAVPVHGLMSTEAVWTMADGETYGSKLSRDLDVTPLTIRYNSGLHVSESGEALDARLEQLVDVYPLPVEELLLIGHSMGGLVLRSAAGYRS